MSKVNGNAIARAVGKNISRKRTECGFTQEEVAEKLAIGYEAISRIERGSVIPNIVRLCEFAEIFNCKVEDLIRGASNISSDQADYIASLIEELPELDKKMIIDVVERLHFWLKK